MGERIWSEYQRAVFEDVASGTGHTMISAVAGSGKTSTILEALRYVPEGASVLFAAFNRSIVNELKLRLICTACGGTGYCEPIGSYSLRSMCGRCCGTGKTSDAEIATLHSLGLRAVSRALNRPVIDQDKCATIARKLLEVEAHPEKREWCTSVVKAVSLCKSHLARGDEEMLEVVDLHGICPPEREEERGAFIKDVRAVINACLDDESTIDFDDMIFLPYVLDLQVPQYDRVFVDETQDLNAAQIALVLKAVRPKGRIVAVGDPRQCIYTFRGAAADAFEKVRSALGAKVLPLSVSYRCARAIVAEAQQIVPYIEAAPGAEEGSVERASEGEMLVKAQPGDFILSRVNAPLLKLCLSFLRCNVPAAIQGRDVGAKLAGVVRRAKTDDVDTMLEYVASWCAREEARLTKRGKDARGIADIHACVDVLSEGESSVTAVVAKILRLFADGDETTRITLSSTHKAKGMERDRAWVLEGTYLLSRGAEGVSIEEQNLKYVAVTRARKSLILVQPRKQS
jgi:DNA helicase-2/ATP-dependent DNA helicase PcrA